MKKHLQIPLALIGSLLVLLTIFTAFPKSASAHMVTQTKTATHASAVSPAGCVYVDEASVETGDSTIILWWNACDNFFHCELIPHVDNNYWVALVYNNQRIVESNSGFRAVGDVMNTPESTLIGTFYCTGD